MRAAIASLIIAALASAAHADDDLAERPVFVLSGTIGLATPGPVTYYGQLDLTIADPVWITVRGRSGRGIDGTDPFDSLDLLVGFDLHQHYGAGYVNMMMFQGSTTIGGAWYDVFSTGGSSATVRDRYVLAGGVKSLGFHASLPGQDGSFRFAHIVEAGFQYHSDSSLGTHRTIELYGLRNSKSGALGMTALWHTSVARDIVGGMELGWMPSDDGDHIGFWAIIDLGVAFEL